MMRPMQGRTTVDNGTVIDHVDYSHPLAYGNIGRIGGAPVQDPTKPKFNIKYQLAMGTKLPQDFQSQGYVYQSVDRGSILSELTLAAQDPNNIFTQKMIDTLSDAMLAQQGGAAKRKMLQNTQGADPGSLMNQQISRERWQQPQQMNIDAAVRQMPMRETQALTATQQGGPASFVQTPNNGGQYYMVNRNNAQVSRTGAFAVDVPDPTVPGQFVRRTQVSRQPNPNTGLPYAYGASIAASNALQQ